MKPLGRALGRDIQRHQAAVLAVHVRQVGPGPVVEALGEKLRVVVSFDVAKAGGLESAFERVKVKRDLVVIELVALPAVD